MLNAVRPFIDFYRVASFTASVPPSRGFRGALEGLARGWRAHQRYKRLELMTDRELAQLGLDRSSIGHYAFFSDQSLKQD